MGCKITDNSLIIKGFISFSRLKTLRIYYLLIICCIELTNCKQNRDASLQIDSLWKNKE